jgi:hypothetical protein
MFMSRSYHVLKIIYYIVMKINDCIVIEFAWLHTDV